MFFLPRRELNFMESELNRAIRYNGKQAEYISFKLPRKGGNFDSALYPPAPCQEYAVTCEEWASGIDKDPCMAEFDPSTVEKSHSAHKRASIFRKKVAGEIVPIPMKMMDEEEKI